MGKNDVISRSELTERVKVLFKEAQIDVSPPFCAYDDEHGNFLYNKALGRREAYGKVLEILGMTESEQLKFITAINAEHDAKLARERESGNGLHKHGEGHDEH